MTISQTTGRLFRTGNFGSAIESNNSTRAYYQARQKTSADGGDQGGSLDGQPNEHAADGLLLSKETRKGFGQSNLRDGAKTFDDYLCDVKERIGLLVSGRPFV